ncbi:MAG: ATP-binding cassette domain-containing protein [Chlamydiota bacterium]
MDYSIRVRDLRKKYRVYFEKPALIKNILPFLVSQGKAQEFWALDGISFSMEKGECIGIIGPNGSGKSTILTILAGVSSATEGEVFTNGKVSSLLSLGAGFNFELTGQENVYLNGAILGLSKAQIDRIYDDIVKFADLGKFMNAKLATYSAGMNMRLGFAIAVMVPFDILLMDEVMAVGDLSFQTKCFRTMRKFCEDEGKTIVFVSHDLLKVEEICSSAIWFEHGRAEAMGLPGDVVAAYKERYREKLALGPVVRKEAYTPVPALVTVDAGRELRRIPETIFGSNVDMFGDGFWLCDRPGKRLNASALAAIEPFGFRLLRYPGMQHADYFHWREAVGESRTPQVFGTDLKKPKLYPHFGPAEFLQMCGALGAAPMLTLNAGTGTPEEAAGWVSWVRERYRGPLYLEIGHELYYDKFHPLGVDFPWTPERYARACGEFSRAVRGADPSARIGVQCCLENGAFTRYRDPRWNEAIFALPPETFDFLSIHHASLPILNITLDYHIPTEDDTWAALIAAPQFVERSLEALAAQAGRITGKKDIPIALSEYGCNFTNVPNVVHGTHQMHDRCPDSVEWGRNHTFAAALYEAGVLHACLRRPELFLSARMTLSHPLFSSLVSPQDGEGMPLRHPQSLMHDLCNRFAGATLVHTHAAAAECATPALGFVPANEHVLPCDVVGVKDAEGKKLALSVINRSIHAPLDMRLDIRGFDARHYTMRVVQAETPDCSSTLPGPHQVTSWERSFRARENRGGDGMLRLGLPKHSLSVIAFSREDWI